jgi:OmpA-OmpF porin, OOP family
MKNISFKILIVFCFIASFYLPSSYVTAQRQMLGANATMINYQAPYDGAVDNFQRYGSGVELYYRHQLKNGFGFSFPARIGVSQKYESSSNFTYIGLDARVHYSFLKPGTLVIPILFTGIGGLYDKPGSFRAEIPIGGGLDIPVAPQIGIQVTTSYRIGIEANTNSIQHTIGFVYKIGQKSKVDNGLTNDIDKDGVIDEMDDCPTIPGVAALKGCPDTDGDGIPDHLDDCPTFAGTLIHKGCPDTDGDGLPDHLDNCPQIPGLKENGGCPVDDSDGDGISDEDDKCPEEAGLIKFNGCPDTDGDDIPDYLDDCPNQKGPKYLKGCPDSDGDGVPDYADKCILIPGPVSNFGCPELKKEEKQVLVNAMQSVQFDLNSSELKKESFAILDQVVELMKKYDYYDLSIEGHTDNIGKEAFNQLLSENRANRCKDYLISKGINASRVTSKGYGIDKPIADNNTVEGRMQNRRVEFIMKLQ